ncbi:G-rich sequence factor 1 [Polypterus senegalus]|uniref:G-rich sequence factor 1 n=1 Tax=Polypterus senegalus TaxID=55291 RepID=UPI0019659CC4|nr:G-rich sequence factor 1 [Polypterus senegalus]XP_039614498.1 G-rich sequence factor 1 [Polypterus senegalus]
MSVHYRGALLCSIILRNGSTRLDLGIVSTLVRRSSCAVRSNYEQRRIFQNLATSIPIFNSWLTVSRTFGIPLKELRAFSQTGVPYKEDEYLPLPEYVEESDVEPKKVFVVRARGLPWSCTVEEIQDFFSECRIRDGTNGIHMTSRRNGKPTGEAFIELESEEDVVKALDKHRMYMGSRYVEVFEVTENDVDYFLKKSVSSSETEAVIRLRGLPFNSTEEDIVQFFEGLQITRNGITFVTDERGRNVGDAFVQFDTAEMADQALLKDRQTIGNRYIEVFKSKMSEITNQSSAYRRKQSGSKSLRDNTFEDHRTSSMAYQNDLKFCIHMRGLPFEASGQDIANYFYPVTPVKIYIEYGPEGRATGEADVYFSSHTEAVEAMKKDRSHIKRRYIELFLNSQYPSP